MNIVPEEITPDLINALQRLINPTNTGEGAVLPPQMVGGTRVPIVTRFTLLKTVIAPVSGDISTSARGTFTLSWVDATTTSQIDHYNIYTFTLPFTGSFGQPSPATSGIQETSVATAHQSPANITVPLQNNSIVVFVIQTALRNGMVSNITSSPSLAYQVVAQNGNNNSFSINGFTWTSNSPGAGKVAWSSGQVFFNGQTYNIDAGDTGGADYFIYWDHTLPNVLSHGGAPIPTTLTSSDYVIAYNNLGIYNPAADLIADDGTRSIVWGSGFDLYNNADFLAGSYVVGSTGGGNIYLADGTGTGSLAGGIRIRLGGATGLAEFGSFEIERNNASVDPNFKHMTTASATAGGVQTVPATVRGYLKVLVDGTARRIPYFDT